MKFFNAFIKSAAAEDYGTMNSVIRWCYFSLAYNTTSAVNAMLAIGTMTPYLLYLDWQGDLTIMTVVNAIALTLLSVYCYNIIYLINDFIDRRKDEALDIAKYSARHVFGPRRYLAVYGAGFIGVMAITSLIWPHLIVPVLLYCVALGILSVIHSYWKRVKPFTIFIERLAKFGSPLWFIALAGGDHTALMFLAGALLVYPGGFTMDYAYRGYLRDRLGWAATWRFLLYGGYWGVVLFILATDHRDFDLVSLIWPVSFYLIAYGASLVIAHVLAGRLPLQFLQNHYDPETAQEKRRLLAYGLTQLLIMSGAIAYAVLT